MNFSNLGQHWLPGGAVIILLGRSGGFNLVNYQVREALCISPSPSQSHLWTPRWRQTPALTLLLNHHISDSLSYQRWMECLQTGEQTRCSHGALREDALPLDTRKGENWTRPCLFPAVYLLAHRVKPSVQTFSGNVNIFKSIRWTILEFSTFYWTLPFLSNKADSVLQYKHFFFSIPLGHHVHCWAVTLVHISRNNLVSQIHIQIQTTFLPVQISDYNFGPCQRLTIGNIYEPLSPKSFWCVPHCLSSSSRFSAEPAGH